MLLIAHCIDRSKLAPQGTVSYLLALLAQQMDKVELR
jgi:hypothetical protein